MFNNFKYFEIWFEVIVKVFENYKVRFIGVWGWVEVFWDCVVGVMVVIEIWVLLCNYIDILL